MPRDRILTFLSEIGLDVRQRALPEDTFVPGILIEDGGLVVDLEKLAYPGDLLHEAGHLAVATPSERRAMGGNLQTGPGEEMAAIAWSFAASVHLGIAPEVVFHPAGYKGEAVTLAENFSRGHYLGVPLLQWYGLTRERDDGSGACVYPRMQSWLRAEPVVST